MNDNVWKGMLIASVVLLVLLGISVPFTDRNSPTFVIIALATVHLLAAIAILSALLYFDWDPFEPFRN